MKITILAIDVVRACCDPDLYFKKGSFQHTTSQHLDKTAQDIAEFVDEARGFVERIGWVTQHSNNRPGEERDYTPEERAFHHVRPIPTEDDLLPKTQMSPYEEHTAYFDKLKQDGIDTVILTGVYAEHCVYWTLADLVDNGFKVIVPTNLVASMAPHNPMYAFSDFLRDASEGKVIFTDGETVIDMLYEDEADRTPPRARYSPSDIHNANFYSFSL